MSNESDGQSGQSLSEQWVVVQTGAGPYRRTDDKAVMAFAARYAELVQSHGVGSAAMIVARETAPTHYFAHVNGVAPEGIRPAEGATTIRLFETPKEDGKPVPTEESHEYPLYVPVQG